MAQQQAMKQPRKSKKTTVKRVVRRVRLWWKKASWRQRIRTIVAAILALLLVVAVSIPVVRFVSWRVAVHSARHRQQELTQTYDFDPGNIISDEQFFNGTAMNAKEIQAFLDEQGKQCTGERCLKSMTFDTHPREANEYCSRIDLDGKQTAATIIAAASKACSVSPKVLLTMLQKEQQLVSATDPSDFQFKSAMGLSCPDDAQCDPKYAGFYNQVAGSAERYQYYVHHEEQYGYQDGQLNYVRYHPNESCGGEQVWIENKATALLYIYTPYQPNRAALDAGVGEGDQCSTYGNRNFSIIYSNWFGDPRV
ncbi:hypothetical protein [Bifidobacterium gallicum]|uniref:Hemagglutinin n=1 Tax=Bifidobacterium gallicum DSM 20093 = LMG 11596 TaxID=561180 RepID=D1NSU7_9BIFI|nr:hypothetical protein [Bifidobacterium gallicum]EFA23749.1 hypothetical protein BIFGAL_02857 [Bifidobacterium gallicum DSM 20093 = LMG 11596]KFI59234.1 hemagglutinin [Bifidobacterium gallicum DSM 20093 = LMG 11596]